MRSWLLCWNINFNDLAQIAFNCILWKWRITYGCYVSLNSMSIDFIWCLPWSNSLIICFHDDHQRRVLGRVSQPNYSANAWLCFVLCMLLICVFCLRDHGEGDSLKKFSEDGFISHLGFGDGSLHALSITLFY